MIEAAYRHPSLVCCPLIPSTEEATLLPLVMPSINEEDDGAHWRRLGTQP